MGGRGLNTFKIIDSSKLPLKYTKLSLGLIADSYSDFGSSILGVWRNDGILCTEVTESPLINSSSESSFKIGIGFLM